MHDLQDHEMVGLFTKFREDALRDVRPAESGQIRAASHRRRQVRTATVAAVTVVALAVSVAVWAAVRPQAWTPSGDPIGIGGSTVAASPCAAVRPTPSSSDQPSYEDVPRGEAPTPKETEAAAVPRLSNVLNAAFEDHLPGRSVADVIHVGCHWVQFEPHVYPALYYAWADVTDSAGTGGIVVMINDKPHPAMGYGNVQTLADGTQVGWTEPDLTPSTESRQFQLGVLRTDGTHITVVCFNTKGLEHLVARPSAPVTVDEVVAIATDPGLTLYP